MTPLITDHNLDADDYEDLEHRYRTLENVLGTNTVPGLAHRDVCNRTDQLYEIK